MARPGHKNQTQVDNVKQSLVNCMSYGYVSRCSRRSSLRATISLIVCPNQYRSACLNAVDLFEKFLARPSHALSRVSRHFVIVVSVDADITSRAGDDANLK
jgi:hypothetical protein